MGILQTDNIKVTEREETVMKKYRQRIGKVLTPKLSPTEALIMVAQDQSMSTDDNKTMIYKLYTSNLCRQCEECDEAIYHIASEYTAATGHGYMTRHNKVCYNLHRNILKVCDFDVSKIGGIENRRKQ